MKKYRLASVVLAMTALACGAERKATPGPQGGKLLENSAPRAEFLIGPDNRAVITFYDRELKPVPVAGQVVAVMAEPPSGKVSLVLENKAGAFVSKEPLPAGEDYTVVVQVKATADAKPQNFRFKFNLNTCAECTRKEYACICDH